MSGFKFDIKGLDETLARMDFSIRKVNTGANDALKDGAEAVKGRIRANTPLGPGLHGEHAKDHVVQSNVKTDGAYKSVDVGYSGKVAWRMWFLEEGTYSKGNPKGIAPRKIVARSFDESKDSAERLIADGIKALIDSL